MSDLSDRTTVVVGASRGLGRGIALAFDEAGAPVVAVARSRSALDELVAASRNIQAEAADAADATTAWSLLDRHRPRGSHPRRRCQSGDAIASAPDVGDVLRQLAHRRQDRVHVAARGAAATAAARQSGDRGQQRRRDQRFTRQRRLRRREGHATVHRRICPRRVAPLGSRHHRHRGHAEDDSVRRRRKTRNPGVLGPQRTIRAGLPRAAGTGRDPGVWPGLSSSTSSARIRRRPRPTIYSPVTVCSGCPDLPTFRSGSRRAKVRRRRSTTARPDRTSPPRTGRAARRRPRATTPRPAVTTASDAGSPGTTSLGS